ncbi:MAG: iron ABC transporter permease [Pseudomonadota bacterium]
MVSLDAPQRSFAPGKLVAVYVGLTALLMVAMFCALTIGPVSLTFAELWAALIGQGTIATETILMDIRAPRMVLGIMVGGSLAISGACLQGLLRNPLADPGLIGITAGASLAVVFVIVLGAGLIALLPPVLEVAVIPLAAFAGGMAVTFLVLGTASIGGQFSVARLILVGVAITAISGAMIGVMILMSNDQQLRELTFWTMGSLARSNWSTVVIACVIMVVASLALLRYRRELDMMQLGERAAFHAGVDVGRVKFQICFLVAIAVGAGVSAAGPIGFVGLVAPHMTRLFIRSSHFVVLPVSALVGANILLFADLFVRNAIPPSEIPIGIATSLLGGPFFLWLLLRNRRI